MPINVARDVVDQLGTTGRAAHGCARRHRHGRARPVRRRRAHPGVWCPAARPRWPTSHADDIVSGRGRRRGRHALATSWRRCGACKPADPVDVTVVRAGKRIAVPVVLGRSDATPSTGRLTFVPLDLSIRGASRDHERMSTTSELTTDEFLDDTDRELLNALQWDFPVDPTPYATLADRLGLTEADVFDTHRPGQGRRHPAPAVRHLRHPHARLRVVARGREGRPRAHRRRRRRDQRAPRRQPQLQAQPRLQPLVHARGAARSVDRRPPRPCCTAIPDHSSPASSPRCSSTRSA